MTKPLTNHPDPTFKEEGDDNTISLMAENDEIKAKWPKVLVEYAEVSYRAIAEAKINGVDEAMARRLAYKVVMALAKQRGGQIEYLPKGKALETAIKHKQIWDEFNGKNTEYLAEKFGINRIDIYKIIRQQREIHSNKIQASLF